MSHWEHYHKKWFRLNFFPDLQKIFDCSEEKNQATSNLVLFCLWLRLRYQFGLMNLVMSTVLGDCGGSRDKSKNHCMSSTDLVLMEVRIIELALLFCCLFLYPLLIFWKGTFCIFLWISWFWKTCDDFFCNIFNVLPNQFSTFWWDGPIFC